MSLLKKASDVTQREGDHSLVMFKFSGIHDHTHGRQMDEYMRSLVGTSPGAGIIIDLLDYEYVYGNDMTALFMVGFDQRSKALRPVCLVAVGGTRSGLESLLAASKFAVEGGLDVAVVPTIEEARQAVRAMRKTAVQKPKTANVSPPVLPAAGPTVASAGQRFPIDFPWLEGFVPVETRLEGIVHARRYEPDGRGKQFLGAVIECSDEKVWVIAYEEQSPFHEFAGRRVVAFGEPYQPEGQHLIGWGGGKQLGHFHVATVRPAEVTPDLELAEVGPGHKLGGRLERETSDTGESMLFFITQEGDTFLAANDPIGAAVGRDVEVWAYCVQLSPLTRRPPGRYLWIICPYSAADLWEWRRRRS